MTEWPTLTRFLAVLLLSGTLAACETAEERAEGHYTSAKELISEGQIEKAIVEFRNVFQLNGKHVAARMDYANLMLERGDIREAVSHYNLIVEQQPKHLPARRALARLLLQAQQWEAAERHLAVALETAPDDLELLGFRASLDYRDENKRQQAVELARRVLKADPAQLAARLVVIESLIEAEKIQDARQQVDTALAYSPKDLQLHLVRLAILEKLGDMSAIGNQLVKMSEDFPQKLEVHQALVRWHLSQGDADGAEKAMRSMAATAPEDASLAMAVVGYLEQTKGVDAAREELLRLSEGGNNRLTFRRALALLDFQLGNTEGAFAAARTMLEDSETDSEKADVNILTARLHYESGDPESATPLVEEVLAQDSNNVDALILRAEIYIDAEEPENAIQDLRTALNNSVDNPQLLSLLAKAHIRNGSIDLARDRLAQALDASRGGAAESLAYANFLVAEKNLLIAEDVLIASLRVQPGNTILLRALADLRLRREDWEGALEIAAILREIDPTGLELSAEAIEVSSLSGRKQFDESIARIEAVLNRDENQQALAALIQLYMSSDQAPKAEATLRDALASDASNATASMLLGAVLQAGERRDEAEVIYRNLIGGQPEFPQSYVLLYRLLYSSGRLDEAGAVLELGAKATSGDSTVLLALAAYQEITGDYLAAINTYDILYNADPNSLVLANNLASLLSEHKMDKQSQDRAFRIAKRFRNSDVPAFQDTYGWILYRRGSFARALVPLQSALDGLPENPLVVFHYGMILAELGKAQDAIEMLERAVELAGEATNLPQIEEAKTRISTLKVAVAE